MPEEIIIFITAGNKTEANQIAKVLIQEKLAACVNMIDPVESVFKWQNKMSQEKEILMMVKSINRNMDKIITMVKQNHSYDVPEIIAMPIISGSKEYLSWLREESSGR
jgi:periplasmic divalent cation tolerance protein